MLKKFTKRPLLSSIFWLAIFLLAGCETLLEASQPQPGLFNHYSESTEHYLQLAETAETPQKQSYQLQAVGRMLQEHDNQSAAHLLVSIDTNELPLPLQDQKKLLEAKYSSAENHSQQALNFLGLIESPSRLPEKQQIAYYQLLSEANAQLDHALLSAEALMTLDPLLNTQSEQLHNRQVIWHELQKMSSRDLANELRYTPYGQLHGWLEAAYINKQYSTQPDILQNEIRRWQQHYPQHPANDLMPKPSKPTRTWFIGHTVFTPAKKDNEVKIALLLPISGKLASSGEAIKNGYMTAYYEAKGKPNAPKSIDVYDTNSGSIQSVYKKAVRAGATVIVGPLTKKNVQIIEKSRTLPVPTLALNYTENGGANTANLYQFALSPQNEAEEVAKQAVRDKLNHALIIAPDSKWGQGVAKAFQENFTAEGGVVVETMSYNRSTNMDLAIKKLLHINKSNLRTRSMTRILGKKVEAIPQRRIDADMVFLIANTKTARQVKPLLKFHYSGDLPVYSISEIYSGTLNKLRDKDLDGIKFCDSPWVLSSSEEVKKAHDQMLELLPEASDRNSRLFAFGLDAYQLSSLLNPPRLPHFGEIPGMTGNLYLNQHQILRQLLWAKFQDGQVQSVNG